MRGVWIPKYLSEADAPWLRALIDERLRFVGRPAREYAQRMTEPLPFVAPFISVLQARYVLDRMHVRPQRIGISPRHVRAVVFAQGALHTDRDLALSAAAEDLSMDMNSVVDLLFADLPDARALEPLSSVPSPTELALRTNLSIVQGLVAYSSRIEISVSGNARDLVRFARLRGLLCSVTPAGMSANLEFSGPYALFRQTRAYGAALASVVPRLPWCNRFEMRATCHLGAGVSSLLILRPGDPVFPAREPRRFDSKIEERFARDFARRAPEWDVIREPRPILRRGRLIFPDFELAHRSDVERRWLVEIVGFWTAEYIRDKLDALRDPGLGRFIVCVDADRNCDADDFPGATHVIQYRRRIDVEEVLRVIE